MWLREGGYYLSWKKKYIYWKYNLINTTVRAIRRSGVIYLVYRSRDRCVIQSLRRTWSGSTHAQCLRPADPHRRRCWETNRCDGTWIPSERSAHSGQEGKTESLGGLQARVGVNGWRRCGVRGADEARWWKEKKNVWHGPRLRVRDDSLVSGEGYQLVDQKHDLFLW